ncbi:zinc finger, CCHC-type containing protein [Tanacetum coccineum]|uniref:Zinc finger, CCHC-type containing protein n=1 Tax=Tanacetum coccineum TaxID=301880 RepID=A0ABQ5AKD2_9ASTR
MESLPLVEAAFAVVSGEESHRNATFVWTAKLPTTAFVAKSFENMRRCFKLVGNPADYVKKNFNANTRLVSSNNSFADVHSNNAFSSNDTTNKSHVSTSNEQLFRLMSLLNDIGVFTANANMPCENQHMAIHAKFLINIMDISNLGLTVCHPNGTQDLITKIGDLKINNDITLYDVLVVLEYIVSLLSVHMIARHNERKTRHICFRVEYSDLLVYRVDMYRVCTHWYISLMWLWKRLSLHIDVLDDEDWIGLLGYVVIISMSRRGGKVSGTRDEVSNQHSYCFNVEDSPKIFDKAIKSQDVAFWKESINDEMDSIVGNNTWVLDDLPLVACTSTIKLQIALASIHSLIIHQMDVKSSVLNSKLEEEVYMNQLQGFIMPGNKNKVCKLIKSIYGLKQSLKQCKFEESSKGGIICLYVDEILIFGTNKVQVDMTKEFFSSKFSKKDMGEVDVILSIRIKHESNGIAIS